MLMAKGQKAASARSFLGKLVRNHSQNTVAAWIAKCEREQIEDPVSWLAAVANNTAKRAAGEVSELDQMRLIAL